MIAKILFAGFSSVVFSTVAISGWIENDPLYEDNERDEAKVYTNGSEPSFWDSEGYLSPAVGVVDTETDNEGGGSAVWASNEMSYLITGDLIIPITTHPTYVKNVSQAGWTIGAARAKYNDQTATRGGNTQVSEGVGVGYATRLDMFEWVDDPECDDELEETTFYTKVELRGDYLNAANSNNGWATAGRVRVKSTYAGNINAGPNDTGAPDVTNFDFHGTWDVSKTEGTNFAVNDITFDVEWTSTEGWKAQGGGGFIISTGDDDDAWNENDWDNYIARGTLTNMGAAGLEDKVYLVADWTAGAKIETWSDADYAEAYAKIRIVSFSLSMTVIP